ncbi:hypothetical protein N7495_002679 [Penicillium taxi]|uniref:uncharacterized protein n=1 Tax=Penicillium taxi TaxID=168475 RepID=UPI002545030F|nr:uncharacterized protein N7495_002679 [Penicillium taxi]KAJ5902151.1 hypothetical protein N7495_002679 [Penicillium taxi]
MIQLQDRSMVPSQSSMVPLQGGSLTAFIVATVSLAISLFAVCLRCFVRINIVKAFGLDDAFMVFAMKLIHLLVNLQLLNMLFCICGIMGSLNGTGLEMEPILVHGTLENCLFWWWLGSTSYIWVCAMARISIAILLIRLTVVRAHIWILYGVIFVTSVVGLVFWAFLTFQCHPVSYWWRQAILLYEPSADITGSCLNISRTIANTYVYSVTSMICDLTLAILPLFMVWKLQMELRTKALLAGILAMGGIISEPLFGFISNKLIGAQNNISIWSNVEACLGITAGSLATIRPLFRRFHRSSYAKSKSDNENFPLPVARGNPNGPHAWRADNESEETQIVITTISPTHKSSQASSHRDLYDDSRSDRGSESELVV